MLINGYRDFASLFPFDEKITIISSMDKALSNKIYYATFVLALFVVALHASYLEFLDPSLAGYDFAYIIQRLFLVICDAAVPTFFAISGFLLFSKFTLKGYPKMLLRKVFSLVIPYFIWSATALVIMQVIYPLIQGEAITMTFQSAVVDLLLAKECPHLWFIQPLAVYFVASPILYFTFKWLKKWSIVIPIALFFVYMFFRPYYGGVLLWIPLFFTGSYLAYFKIPVLNSYRPRSMSYIAIGVMSALAVTFTLTHAEYEDYAYYVYRFAAPLLVWFALDALSPLFKKEKIHPIFTTSAFIFFSHLFVVTGVKLLLELGLKSNSNYRCAALFFLVFFLASAIDLLITYLLQHFAKQAYKLLGGR